MKNEVKLTENKLVCDGHCKTIPCFERDCCYGKCLNKEDNKTVILELEKIKQKLLDLQEKWELKNQDIKDIALICQELQLLQDSIFANSKTKDDEYKNE